MGQAWRARGTGAAVAASVLAALLAVPLAVLLAGCSSGGGPAPVPSRARAYANVDACLLTGPAGVADPAAAPVWAGMEDVSATGQARTSYLAASGPATAANAMSYLGSLLVSKCTVIVAVGAPERAAVLAQAARFPSVHFLILGTAGQAPSNVDALAFTAAGTRTAVANAIRSLLG